MSKSPKSARPAYDLTDAEKRDLIQLIQQGYERNSPKAFAALVSSFAEYHA